MHVRKVLEELPRHAQIVKQLGNSKCSKQRFLKAAAEATRSHLI